jgi:hypothetical protein
MVTRVVNSARPFLSGSKRFQSLYYYYYFDQFLNMYIYMGTQEYHYR